MAIQSSQLFWWPRNSSLCSSCCRASPSGPTSWASWGGSLFGGCPGGLHFSPLHRRLLSTPFLCAMSSPASLRVSCSAPPSLPSGCLEGLNTTGGAEQVGRSTTRAVVYVYFSCDSGRPCLLQCFSISWENTRHMAASGRTYSARTRPLTGPMISLRNLRVSYKRQGKFCTGLILTCSAAKRWSSLAAQVPAKSTLLRTLVGP